MKFLPGMALGALVSLAALGLQGAQRVLLGTVWMEALPLALLLGMAVRFVRSPGPRWQPGIRFMAQRVLEFAIVLLGAALDTRLLRETPPTLVLATFALVVATIGSGIFFGRLCGLPTTLSLLVASGNAICGNAAISALAPSLRADEREVAQAISFTAVLGMGMVILLPYLAPLLHLTHRQYGILAGWSVYAVPQVLAATFPVSLASGEMGTIVKLLRVLTLGPVAFALSWLRHRHRPALPASAVAPRSKRAFLPWFLIGFGLCALLRSGGFISPEAALSLRSLSEGLTTLAMASLGLMVDVRGVARSGPRVAIVALLSLAVLLGGGLLALSVCHFSAPAGL